MSRSLTKSPLERDMGYILVIKYENIRQTGRRVTIIPDFRRLELITVKSTESPSSYPKHSAFKESHAARLSCRIKSPNGDRQVDPASILSRISKRTLASTFAPQRSTRFNRRNGESQKKRRKRRSRHLLSATFDVLFQLPRTRSTPSSLLAAAY